MSGSCLLYYGILLRPIHLARFGRELICHSTDTMENLCVCSKFRGGPFGVPESRIYGYGRMATGERRPLRYVAGIEHSGTRV